MLMPAKKKILGVPLPDGGKSTGPMALGLAAMGMVLVGLVALALLTLSIGCSGIKVDCEKMCSRTFKECLGEVAVAKGKVDKDKLELLKKTGAFKKMQESGYSACMKDCKKKKGFGSDAAEINKCLTKKACTEYAPCIKKHIK